MRVWVRVRVRVRVWVRVRAQRGRLPKLYESPGRGGLSKTPWQ